MRHLSQEVRYLESDIVSHWKLYQAAYDDREQRPYRIISLVQEAFIDTDEARSNSITSEKLADYQRAIDVGISMVVTDESRNRTNLVLFARASKKFENGNHH